MLKNYLKMNKPSYHAVLFDLDGTLFDTAPDLAYALNMLCTLRNIPTLPLEKIRPHAGHGSRSLLKLAFNINESHSEYSALQTQFLKFYQSHIAKQTQLFEGIDRVIHYLHQIKMPWGIVTNKPEQLTTSLLKILPLPKLPHCIVCGDSLPQRKPNPAPILHACTLLQQDPCKCLYVGDTQTDVIASKAAGTHSLVTLYGYIAKEENPYEWQATGYVKNPTEIISWIESSGNL